MCGRTTLFKKMAEIVDRWKAEAEELLKEELSPRYNLSPSTLTPVIIEGRKIVMKKWGFELPWDKSKYMINIRAETLLNKTNFKKYLEGSRCIMPVDGFYEWTKDKQPYRFTMRDEGLFGIGAIFKENGFCLITTEANEIVGKVHHRMPVIIPRELEDIWLNPKTKLYDYVSCLAPFPSKEMVSYRVSDRLNSSKNEGMELIRKI